jgi:hypothetical protein
MAGFLPVGGLGERYRREPRPILVDLNNPEGMPPAV